MLPSAKEERHGTEPRQAGAICLDAKVCHEKEQEIVFVDSEVSSSAPHMSLMFRLLMVKTPAWMMLRSKCLGGS